MVAMTNHQQDGVVRGARLWQTMATTNGKSRLAQNYERNVPYLLAPRQKATRRSYRN
jgi:predicted secreted protein